MKEKNVKIKTNDSFREKATLIKFVLDDSVDEVVLDEFGFVFPKH